MVRAISYKKNIVSLESFWTYNIEHPFRLSVVPLLDILSKRNGTRSISLTCNTIDELKFNLEIAKRMKGFHILYLAFHGYPGGIYLPDLAIKMESLATYMGKGFRNWIIFFDSCRTLNVSKDRILEFISKTEAKMVIGYEKNVDWIEGAAVDLLVLNWLQFYRDMRKFWKRFKRAHRDLVGITGLQIVTTASKNGRRYVR